MKNMGKTNLERNRKAGVSPNLKANTQSRDSEQILPRLAEKCLVKGILYFGLRNRWLLQQHKSYCTS